MILLRCLFTFAVCLVAAAAAAQPAPAAQPSLVDLLNSAQGRFERVSANHMRLTGDVEIEPSAGLKFSADVVDIYIDTNKIVASGNVVFTNPEGRIAAERVEFDLGTGTGTFHVASGIMSMGDTVDRAQFGGQDPDVYFYGDTIEKVSARQYKITRGGFSTCVQPTPRWEVVSKSVTINLDEYAIARNMVLRVKGVPLLYLPVIYYPIQEDERATGFLMPTYGTSTIRGQAISNAFFWAIDRSQDATFFHDWYTRAGQGVGGEYRYQSGLSSYGSFRAYRFAQQENQPTGTSIVLPEETTYTLQGLATQTLSRNIRARGRVDYFTSLATQQLYQQNVYNATRPYRVVEGGLNASIGRLSTSFQYQRSELFSDEDSSSVYGATPRAAVSLAPQTLFGSPIYGSVNADYSFLPNKTIDDGEITLDSSLGRFDVAPSLRVPLSRLTFLAVNTSAAYRTTYYSRSRAAGSTSNSSSTLVPEGLVRQFLNVRTDIIGPVLAKIWDTPDSTSTERMKHVIEPAFTIDYTTGFSQQERVPFTSDVSDFVVGGTTRVTYGLTNRLFYRSRNRPDGTRGTTREFVTIGLQQTYYSNEDASLYDTTYAGPRATNVPVELSPVALTTRVTPTDSFDINTRTEYDISGNGLQMVRIGGLTRFSGPSIAGTTPRNLSASVNYSRVRYRRTSSVDQYLSLSTTSAWMNNRLAANYGLSWNISGGYVQSQTVMASYMAQCCGIQADIQINDLPASFGIGSDRRFNVSFVLAGLGTFSNFFGAFAQR